MNKETKKEKKMYFISDNEYIYFPFSNINCIYNTIKRYGNQLICLNPPNRDVIHIEWL